MVIRAIYCVCNISVNLNMRVQGRSTKIKSGQAIDDVNQLGGSGGMTPRNIFEMLIFCEYFGAILGPSTLQ